jgi:hypothetical protein
MTKSKYVISSVSFLVLGMAVGVFLVLVFIRAEKKEIRTLSQNTDQASCSIAASNINRQDVENALDPENASQSEIDSAMAYLKFKQIKSNFMPIGVPAIYGAELNISFDKVQDAINKVSLLDPTYGKNKITLSGNDLKRYVDIGSSIACEYCCTATTLVFSDGQAACGCAHSQMMRGLTAYLIKNHPEMSDQDILNQLVLWKRTYFPKETLSAELKKMEDAGDKDVKQILQEFPDFLPDMVGGC